MVVRKRKAKKKCTKVKSSTGKKSKPSAKSDTATTRKGTRRKSSSKTAKHKTQAKRAKKGATKPPSGKEARVPYLNIDGERVPSVTTIIGQFRNSEALIYWAWEQGKKKLDYRQTRDIAATVGSVVHKYAEFAAVKRFVLPTVRQICKDEKLIAPNARQVVTGFNAWKIWAKDNKFKNIQQEVRIVSERHRFGGMFDLCEVNKLRTISDYKTSKRIYLDHIIQIAAYGILWKEKYPCKACDGIGWYTNTKHLKKHGKHPDCKKCKGTGCSKPIHRYQLIHLDKETGEPDVLVIPTKDIEVAERLFLLYREGYELIKEGNKLYGLNRTTKKEPNTSANVEVAAAKVKATKKKKTTKKKR